MLKQEGWLVKVRIKSMLKEKKLLEKLVNGFQRIRENDIEYSFLNTLMMKHFENIHSFKTPCSLYF